MKPLFISYFTMGTPYEREARELEVTLRRFGCDYEVKGVPNLGDWCHNCAQKPTVIRDAMLRHDKRNLVYVDADARIEQLPCLFEELNCDIAYHMRHKAELLSGTIYLQPTAATWALVRDWQKRCQNEPGVWDQKHLHAAVNSAGPGLRVDMLPVEYCYIIDCGSKVEPVILHTQASRRLRNAVKNELGDLPER